MIIQRDIPSALAQPYSQESLKKPNKCVKHRYFCCNLNLLCVLSCIHCAVSSKISVGSVSLLYEAVMFVWGADDC